MKFRPLRDRVATTPVEEDDVSPGGILVPGTAKDNSNQSRKALVVSVGSDVIDIQPRDLVLVGKHSGLDITLEGVDLLIIPQDDVMAVIE